MRDKEKSLIVSAQNLCHEKLSINIINHILNCSVKQIYIIIFNLDTVSEKKKVCLIDV
jgi:hypothetical protein